MSWKTSKKKVELTPFGEIGKNKKGQDKHQEKLSKREQDDLEKDAIKNGKFHGEKKVRFW